MACPLAADGQFGPRVNTHCRDFDFTLDFEDIVFACVPAAVFLSLLPWTLAVLLRRPTRHHASFTLFVTRLIAYVGLSSVQLTLLVLRTQHRIWQTPASLAAGILTLFASVAALALSVVNVQRSLRPSTILTLYFTAVVILSIARVRTFWLIQPQSPVPATSIASLVLAAIVLALESIERRPRVDSEEKAHAPEPYSGFWNRAIFAWLATTFRNGYVSVISVDDLPVLDPQLESHFLHRELVSVYNKCDHTKQHSLLRACWRANMLTFAAAIVPRLCLTAFTFAQPFLINTTVSYVGEVNPNKNYGRGLIGAWALVFLGVSVTNSVYLYHSTRFVTKVRGSLMALIYEHALRIRAVDSGEITAVALMGTDVNRIVDGLTYVHQVWASPIDIGIAIWLLQRQLGLACVAPVILIGVFIGATFFLSSAMRHAQQRWIEKVQTRLRVTTHLLDEIKAVKMLGLEKLVGNLIQSLRVSEIKTSEFYRKLLITMVLLSNTPINLAPIVTFAVYAIISVVTKDTTLLTARAFTALALISLLTTPVVVFIQTLPNVYETMANFDRIQEYCRYGAATQSADEPNVAAVESGQNIRLSTLSAKPKVLPRTSSQDNAISFVSEGIAWNKSQPPVFNDLAISFARGSVTAIVGPVGSGKTTLLESVLGETLAMRGKPAPSMPPAAYCSQEAWLEHATVKQNIISVTPFDEKWYDTVVDCCGLRLDINSFRKGDQMLVGSKGFMLSGGQKQRIALARAVYSRRSIVVLDDVFSGMDARTMETVARRLLGKDGLFRRHQVTVILATHNRHIMSLADTIIALGDGKIQESGSPSALLQGDGYVSRLGLALTSDDDEKTTEEVQAEGTEEYLTKVSAVEEEAIQLSEDIRRKNGDLAVYTYYAKSSGYTPAVVFITCGALWMFCTQFPAIWLKWWSEANTLHPNKDIGYYMGIFAMFGVVGTLLACSTAWFAFIKLISNTALRMHQDVLDSALGAPFHFFTSTDTGELTNRFGQDMELIDMKLPIDLCNYSTTAASCAAQVVIVVVCSKYFGAALPVVATLLYFLQRFYLQTSRQIRLLGIETRAPLYRDFIECVGGAATIRAFGWRASFEERNYRLIDTSQRPEYTLSCVQHWLNFVLDIIVTVIVIIVAAIVVIWKDEIGAGSAGVSLVMIVGFNSTLERLITSWTSMEASIGAVARVRRFIDDTEVEGVGLATYTPPRWPSNGHIEFKGVFASHKPEAEPTLKDITLTVESNHHIAICGRSGSGKTSLVLSLLRMMTVSNGQILVDGVDISTLHPAIFRELVNVVSQDPLLLPETLRFNLDPFARASDSEIVRALEIVGLWTTVNVQGGLDKEMDVSAWSAGQKQLLCLARAIVRKAKILVLDEAMSSVDDETETIMQNIIDSEFRDCTVLAIMHRLKYVDRYDKVAVLDDGVLLEYGKPSTLAMGETRFADLYKSQGR